MPVPDEFRIAPDFQYCEICEQCYPDDKFIHVVVDNEKKGKEHEKRLTSICFDCREKCRKNKTFEKLVTDKVFLLKIGRKLKIKENK